MTLKNLISKSSSSSQPTSLMSFQSKMNDLFDQFFSDMLPMTSYNMISRFPSVSISESTDAITVKAELPSLDEKDIKVEINKNRIIISGEKSSEINESKEIYHLCELSYGKFSRSIALPFEINSESVKASFDKNVLTIEISKSNLEKNKSQIIPIKSNQFANKSSSNQNKQDQISDTK